MVTVASMHSDYKKSPPHAAADCNDLYTGRMLTLSSHLLSVICVQYGPVYQSEFSSIQCSSYLLAGMQSSRSDQGCNWESQYQPWLSIVVYSHQQQFRPLQMWQANPPPREGGAL